MNNLLRYEELVDQHVRHDNKEAAVELLFDLILRHAREKNFEKAEALRERLFEVDPMSLTEIIKSAEIIEEEKNESIDPDHLDVWSGMYDLLTTEEGCSIEPVSPRFLFFFERVADFRSLLLKLFKLPHPSEPSASKA